MMHGQRNIKLRIGMSVDMAYSRDVILQVQAKTNMARF